MSTFSAKGSDIDVEAIMANIRKKIEEKRKGLYTEEEVREIAEMQLDAILDSNEFNSDFVAAFRARDEQWNYTFTPETIYASSRTGGGGLIRSLRGLLNPILKLFFNPNPIISALSRQSDLNRYYVLMLHNMTTEMTRLNLELTNVKARLRSVGVRVDFQTKREKTFEQLTTSVRGSGRRRETSSSPSSSTSSPSTSSSASSSSSSSSSSSGEGRRRGRGGGSGRRPYRRRRGGRSGGSGRGGDSGSKDGGGGGSK